MICFSHNLSVPYYLDELGRRRATSLLGIFSLCRFFAVAFRALHFGQAFSGVEAFGIV